MSDQRFDAARAALDRAAELIGLARESVEYSAREDPADSTLSRSRFQRRIGSAIHDLRHAYRLQAAAAAERDADTLHRHDEVTGILAELDRDPS